MHSPLFLDRETTDNPETPDLVFALAADPYHNSRALRQIRTLADAGIRMHVLSFPGDSSDAVLPENVTVTSVSIRRSGGPAFFREIRRRFLQEALVAGGCHFHASDLYVLGAMASAAKQRGATYSYDARECYPHVASTVRRPWVRWYWKKTESHYVRGAAMVFTVSSSIAYHMARAYSIPEPIVIPNVPTRRTVSRSDYLRDRLGIDPEVPIVIHLGQLRRDRGCDILVQAMKLVPGAHLVFLGAGPEKVPLERLSAAGSAANRIHFIPPVSPDAVLDVAAGATIGVTLLQDTCLNHRYALPNKLFEYIGAGLPVLASDLTEMRQVVSSNDIGRLVDGADYKEVGRAISSMLEDKRQLARWSRQTAVMLETFNWEKASQPFLDAFRPLVNS